VSGERESPESLDWDDLFEAGTAALRAGRLGEAEDYFGRILARVPDQPDALHLIGLCAFEAGRREEGLARIDRAIAVDPNNPAYQSNRGGLLNRLGRHAEAEAACRRSVSLHPTSAAYNNLGLALQGQSRWVDAVAAHREATALDRRNALAWNGLGNALRQLGQVGDAVAAYRSGLAVAAGHPLLLSNLASALREGGRLDDALVAARQAVERDSLSPSAWNNLGTVLMAMDDGSGAAAAFERALRLDAGHAEARNNLASLLFREDRVEEAEQQFREAIERTPASAAAHNGLGVLLLAKGRGDEAAQSFRAAIRSNPRHAEAYYNLAAADREPKAEEITAMKALLAQPGLTAADRIGLHFALGEIEDRHGDVDRAFVHFRDGNDLRRKDLARAGIVFDAAAHDERIAHLVAEPIESMTGVTSEIPVFVVGMPRSGTTLVEQIAASHPAVFGAGEINSVAGKDPKAEAIVAHLTSLAPSTARRVIDKTPTNFLHLGLIARLFPAARIIHCRRDARDTCLSCYMQNFKAALPWTTDLADLGRYYRAYGRLMDHWRRVLPLTMIEIDYEALVADQEGESRRLIEFLGLPWDDACLQFHRTERLVRTASSQQVRRPLYASSVGRWKAYAAHLTPLLDQLR
jgi:tetratricopeptide (TPR) repeat protein